MSAEDVEEGRSEEDWIVDRPLCPAYAAGVALPNLPGASILRGVELQQ
jgi:hypothetical protein